MTNVEATQFYEFGPFRLDPMKRRLQRHGEDVPLTPKAFDTLLALVERRGQVIEKEELMKVLWPDSFVEEANLAVNISTLRKILGEHPREHQYIVTVPGRGYLFVADVRVLPYEAVGSALDPTSSQSIFPNNERPDRSQESSQAPAVLHLHRTSARPRMIGLAVACVVVVITASALVLYRRDDAGSDLSAPIRSIAVLPLKNLSDEPSNEYFSDGMTESLISALSQVSDLKVISHGSVTRYKNKEIDPGEAGKQLGVAAVLEGSVRKSEDSVRVAVRLVSVADGRVLWARDTHERAFGDIFALQDEIARNVVAGLRINLSGAGAQQLTRRYTDNVEAYQLYLKGRYFWNKRTEESLKKSVVYFEQAISADPGNALAYVGLADSYLVLKSLSLVTSQEAHVKVEAALRKGLEIDDTIGEAHTSLAWVKFHDWKWSEAEQEFRRAIELQPNNATTHQWYAEYLSAMGRSDESIAEIRRAQQLEPFSLIINAIAAQSYFFARQYEQTIEQCRKTLELDPNFYLAHDYLGWAYRQKGMYDEAIAEFKKAKQIEDTPLQSYEIAIAHAASGNKEEARKVLHQLIEDSKRKHAPQQSYRLGRTYSALQEADAAFKWLETAFNEREENLVWMKVDPHLDYLRSDPRFADLLRRVGWTL